MNRDDSVRIGPSLITIGQRVRMLVDGMGCDGEDNEIFYKAGDLATVVQIERYSPPQGLGVGVQLDCGVFNMFDAADRPPQYPFIPLSGDT